MVATSINTNASAGFFIKSNNKLKKPRIIIGTTNNISPDTIPTPI